VVPQGILEEPTTGGNGNDQVVAVVVVLRLTGGIAPTNTNGAGGNGAALA
jgi:hypothetical protein